MENDAAARAVQDRGLATSALLSGEAHVSSGRLGVIGISSLKRSPLAPQVPTLAEAGLAGFEYTTWYGMLLPGRTPKTTVDALQSATADVLKSATIAERLVGQGLQVHGSTPGEFHRYLQRRSSAGRKSSGPPISARLKAPAPVGVTVLSHTLPILRAIRNHTRIYMRISLLKCWIAGAAWAAAPLAQAVEITGAGATFPAPIYAKWAEAYQKATGNRMNYQSIGSSGGIRQIRAKTVDFGASDAPLKPDELAKDNLMQFPTVIGGVVPVVNLPGIKPGQLRITGQVLGDIYLGKINKWNDKAIADLNPGVPLPNQDIGVVRRADGSGTTFIFTNYLAKVNAGWKQKIGEGQAVQWPVGLGGKGNEGVAAFVQRLPGSIGYVEYAYAKQNKLTHAIMQNASGAFVGPDDSTFKAAAASADWSKAAFYEILTNMPGKDSWPITGATFILVYKSPEKPQQVAEVLKFFNWAYANGDNMALEMDYVPMPDAVVNQIQSAWASSIKDPSGKSLWAAAR